MKTGTKKLRKSLTVFAAAPMFLTGIQAAQANEVYIKPSVEEAGELTVGSTLSYAPFEFIGEDNKPTGVDVELAQQAAKLMGVDLTLVEVPFVNSLPSLAAGRTDIAWASYTIREDRLKQVDFVAFLNVGIVVSVLPDSVASMQSQLDLCGKTLGVSAGSAASFTVEALTQSCTDAGKAAIEVSTFPDTSALIQATLSGRVDGRLDDATSSGYYQSTSGGKLVVVSGLYDSAPAGLAVPKGDAETAEMMRSALQALIDNGIYSDIFARYGIGSSEIPEAYVVTNMTELR